MNMITVIAHGSPNSFARKVQHDPTIAVNMLKTIKTIKDLVLKEANKKNDIFLWGCVTALEIVIADCE